MPSTPLQAQQPKASSAPLPDLLPPITAVDELRCTPVAADARHPHHGTRSCWFAGAQVQQAASRLSVAKLSGGLFRGNSSGADDMAAAPAAVSSCVGNWLSHLDWDGTRFAPQSAFAIRQYVCLVSQLAGMQCGGKAKTDMSASNTLLGTVPKATCLMVHYLMVHCNRCRMWTLAEEQPETWQPVANPLPSDCRYTISWTPVCDRPPAVFVGPCADGPSGHTGAASSARKLANAASGGHQPL